jgi:hypothetical protein
LSAEEIHVGDIGTEFKYTLYDGDSLVDLSSATDIVITFKRGDDTEISKDGILFTDGTDGIIYCLMTSGDLSVAGKWSSQVSVVFSNGSWHSDITKFNVYENL